MGAWDSPDRYFAITDAAERRRAQSEDIIAEIVNALAVVGEFAQRIDLEPAQRVVDLKWAARQAGRRLGTPIDIHQTSGEASDQTLVRVIARRTQPATPDREDAPIQSADTPHLLPTRVASSQDALTSLLRSTLRLVATSRQRRRTRDRGTRRGAL